MLLANVCGRSARPEPLNFTLCQSMGYWRRLRRYARSLIGRFWEILTMWFTSKTSAIGKQRAVWIGRWSSYRLTTLTNAVISRREGMWNWREFWRWKANSGLPDICVKYSTGNHINQPHAGAAVGNITGFLGFVCKHVRGNPRNESSIAASNAAPRFGSLSAGYDQYRCSPENVQ